MNGRVIQIGRAILVCAVFILAGCRGGIGEHGNKSKLQDEAVWLARYWWTSKPRTNPPDLPKLAEEIQAEQGIVISLNEWRAVKNRADKPLEDADIVAYSTSCYNGKYLVIRADSAVDWVHFNTIPHSD